jgi:hypothetical protein
MAYAVNKTDGTLLVNVADGTVNSSATTINLLGRGVTNYGEIMAENLVWMVEHFANTSAPINPLQGQLWFDTAELKMKVRVGSNWRPVGSVTVQGTTPAGAGEGDLWWNDSTNQLYGYDANGATWVLVGPDSTDPNIALDSTVIGVDLNPGPGQLLLVIVNHIVVAAWSSATYSAAAYASNVYTINVGGYNTSINLPASFPSGIKPGCNLAGNVSNIVYSGTSTSSQYADLAERYSISEEIESGDLVRMCDQGVYEVEKTTIELDPEVFGVISKSPGFMMNSEAGDDSTHPYIALAGRVRVKVIGKVLKGQRLVSSNVAGVARAASSEELSNIYAVFGRALENKDTDDLDLIEVTVGVK